MAQSPTSTPQPVQSTGSSLSFTQGFLLGQLSIALLIFFFIKFFIFGEPPSADDRALHLSSLRRSRTLAHQRSSLHLARPRSSSSNANALHHKSSRSIIRPGGFETGGMSIGTILSKTYYNVKGHQPESLDWFNVLIAQTIAQIREDARQDNAILTSLTDVLNGGVKPDWVGEIRVTEIALGDEFPIFSNCRVMPAEEGGWGWEKGGDEAGRLQARMDVDLSDVITLGVETTLVLNYPKPRTAVLPVALAVSVVRFSGTLAVSFIPSSSPPSTSTSSPNATPGPPQAQAQSRPPPLQRTTASASTTEDPPRPSTSSGPPSRPTTLAFTFLDDYRLDLSVRSLLGSRSRLQDVPKIAQLIESRVHAWFDERAVEPRFQQIVLPSLWPRKRNTRGGQEGGTGEAEDDVPAGEESEGEEEVLSASPNIQPRLDTDDVFGPPLSTTTTPTPKPKSKPPVHSLPPPKDPFAGTTKRYSGELLPHDRERERERPRNIRASTENTGMRYRGDHLGLNLHSREREQSAQDVYSQTQAGLQGYGQGHLRGESRGGVGQRGMPGALE
ncbi:hypothetical protein P154DRAFT_616312 [Amniculicola lignicola CBS 123094]|uniref:Maintenance of mitochondrial morphology protein 1 n=1 Tax=Amniculicola lignicola CBS 123094 TaxID=1392246 RepID=A0A6A5X2I2_9PLEO|nr:hypothetical protein P154DRAFT_616312 [Amniculicola lignicola CBS 123094]